MNVDFQQTCHFNWGFIRNHFFPRTLFKLSEKSKTQICEFMQRRQYMDLHILPISPFHQKAEKLWKQKATMARDRSFWKNNRSRRRRIRFKIEQQRQRQRQERGQRQRQRQIEGQRQKGKRGEESVQKSSNWFFRITIWSHHFKRGKIGF